MRDYADAYEEAYSNGVEDERQRCANKLVLTKSEIRLMCGEMTAQEMRTVQAVLTAMRAKILGEEI